MLLLLQSRRHCCCISRLSYNSRSFYWHSRWWLDILKSMRKWFTVCVLISAMLSSAVGVGAHENEASCPLPNLPACCKKALLRHSNAAVSTAKLCCKLNCSESGTTTSNASNFSQSSVLAHGSALEKLFWSTSGQLGVLPVVLRSQSW
jgi:hypothetical protein